MVHRQPHTHSRSTWTMLSSRQQYRQHCRAGVGISAHITISHSNEWRQPPYAFHHSSFWSSLDNISIYVRSKYRDEILGNGGALRRRNFGVGISAHVTFSHSNGWRQLPYAFQHPSFWSSLDNILIYVLSKYQGGIWKNGGALLRRNVPLLFYISFNLVPH